MCPGADNTANGHANGNGAAANGKGTGLTSTYLNFLLRGGEKYSLDFLG